MVTEFKLNQPGNWLHDLKLFFRYLRLNMMSSVEYKLGFVTIITNVIFNLGVWLVYWSVILGTSDGRFGSWGSKELVIWYFFTEFSIGIFGLFTGVGMVYYYVIDQGLEPVLSKPIHPLVHYAGEGMYFLSVVRSLFSVVILIAGMIIFDISMNFGYFMLALFISCTGVITFTSLYIIAQTFSFWIGNVEFIVETLVDIEMNFIRLPLNLVSANILFSLFVILPVGLFATIPTLLTLQQSIFSQLSPFYQILLVLGIALFTLLTLVSSLKFFDFGLKRYDGVGE